MNSPEAPVGPLWPFIVYAGLVLIVVMGMMVLSYVLGQRHKALGKGLPYESGVTSTGSARVRLPVRFYQIAIFFVIFDLETAFLVVWAVAVREAGWAGYLEMLVFIAILLAALVYLWREGALDGAGQPRELVSRVQRKHPLQPVEPQEFATKT